MSRRALSIFVLLALTLACSLAAASELRPGDVSKTLHVGNLVIHAHGGFAPSTLPKHENAPITLHGGGSLSTKNGEPPPILETIDLEFDRHGAVDTTGLEACPTHRLEATTVTEARRACPNAIVGEGRGHAVAYFPESAPVPVDSPITLFNGPKRHGDDTVIAHAYTTVPVPTTFIVPIVIERIHKGVYGYRTKARIPRIAGGYGVPTSGFLHIGRKWRLGATEHSYVAARCETGHLQARGQFAFKDGTFLSGVFISACEVRR